MNNKILYTKVFNRKNQTNKEGKAPIEICCYLNKRRRYLSTGIYIAPSDWNEKKRVIRQNSDLAITQNALLDQQINQLEKLELQAIEHGEPLTLSVLDDFKNAPTDKTDFLAFVRRQIDEKKGCVIGTIISYQQLLKKLKGWKTTISFSDLTYSFVEGFENYLLGLGLCQNSANRHLRNLRTMINSAINNGLLDANQYPFRNFHIRRIQSDRAHLTAEEIERIENLVIEDNPALKAARDMYLFSIYTGLRFSDVERITPRNVVTTANKTFLTLTMQKTTQPLNIPLHALFCGKPIELIKQYSTADRPTIFPHFHNQYINRLLKEIARRANIQKRVTFHTARHTAATYLLNKGANIVVVQKILGHTDVSTTQIYAKMLGATIEKELQTIFK